MGNNQWLDCTNWRRASRLDENLGQRKTDCRHILHCNTIALGLGCDDSHTHTKDTHTRDGAQRLKWLARLDCCLDIYMYVVKQVLRLAISMDPTYCFMGCSYTYGLFRVFVIRALACCALLEGGKSQFNGDSRVNRTRRGLRQLCEKAYSDC